MQSKVRRLGLSALGVALILSLAACSTKPTSTPGTATAAKIQAPIKVGVILPFSGPYANVADTTFQGIDMYLKTVGYEVEGRKIEIVKEDTELKPNVGLQKTKKLVEQDKVDVILGYVGSNVALAVRDYLDQQKVPTIYTTATSNKLTRDQKGSAIFRVVSNSWQQNASLGIWLPQHGIKKAYLLAADYAGGQEAVADFKAEFIKNGGQIVGEVYFPLGNNDFAPYLGKAMEAKPDVVFGFYGGSDAVKFVQQADKFGFAQKGIKLSASGYSYTEDLLPSQGKGALGAITAINWSTDLDNSVNKQFVADYKAQFKAMPTINVVNGWQSAQAMVEAVKATKGNTEKAALAKAIEGVKFEGPGGSFAFDPETHQALVDIYIREVREVDGASANVKVDVLKQFKDPIK